MDISNLGGFTGLVVLAVVVIIFIVMAARKKGRNTRAQGSGGSLGINQPNVRPDVGRPSYGPITDRDD